MLCRGCPGSLRWSVWSLTLPSALPGLQGLDTSGGNAPAPDDPVAVAAWEAERCDDRIVVMADVWLDGPDASDQLHAVLSGEALRAPGFLFWHYDLPGTVPLCLPYLSKMHLWPQQIWQPPASSAIIRSLAQVTSCILQAYI